MLFTERRARHAFGRCIFCVKWMMVFQSTLLMKKTTIRAARTPMSGEISIHAFRENHVMAYTAASFAAPRSSGNALSIHAPHAVSIAYGVHRFARRIFPSTASAAAASA